MIQSFKCTAVNKLYAPYFNDLKKQCSTDNLLIRLWAKYNRPAHPTQHRCVIPHQTHRTYSHSTQLYNETYYISWL